MFTPPRFVVIDDKQADLDAIVQAFRRLGSLCCGLQYRPEEQLDGRQLRGVRALFMDLHLNEGPAPSNHAQHFATITGILEDHLTEDGGPFVLILWTQKESEVAGLITYLDENLDSAKPWARPVATLSLSKIDFIVDGRFSADKAEDLKAAVLAKLETNPQIAALLSWEGDVVNAASATLKALVDRVATADRRHHSFGPALGLILSRLARAAVGRVHAQVDPRAAMNAVLGPILSDRIIHTPAPKSSELWKLAMPRVGSNSIGAVPADEQAAANRMLHIAHTTIEPAMKGSDWGVVSAVPWVEAETEGKLGISHADLLSKVLKVGPDHTAQVSVVLVRVGATCDHAQARVGPVPFYVGLLLPANVADARENVPKAEWLSPLLSLDNFQGAHHLAVNARFPLTLTPIEAEALQPFFRLREQLLMELVAEAGSYQTRPGIVALRSAG